MYVWTAKAVFLKDQASAEPTLHKKVTPNHTTPRLESHVERKTPQPRVEETESKQRTQQMYQMGYRFFLLTSGAGCMGEAMLVTAFLTALPTKPSPLKRFTASDTWKQRSQEYQHTPSWTTHRRKSTGSYTKSGL